MLAGLRGRDLDAEFMADRSEWKEREQKFTSQMLSNLEESVKEMAETNEGWQKLLKVYADCPIYSPDNIWLARQQLFYKGVEAPGAVMSESAWRARGRRVKAEFAKPIAKRDRQFGYDNNREWDQSHAAELILPFGGSRGFKKRDANGNDELGTNGKPIIIGRKRPIGFKAFIAYHEDATEALDGGTPLPLGNDTEWAGATGSDEDAEKLLEKTKRFCASAGIDLKEQALGKLEVAGKRDPARGTVVVNTDAPIADQATVALRGYFQGYIEQEYPGDDSHLAKRREAAAESAKYVVASLFGLDSEEQSFPHMAEIATTPVGQKSGLKDLQSMIHVNVASVMGILDPAVRAKAHQDAKYSESRAARRKKTKRSPYKKKGAVS